MADRRNRESIRRRASGESGFTLVELLIAVFLFAIVISSVYGSYSATFTTVDGAEERLKISAGASIVLERIADDLSGVVAAPGGYFRGEMQEHLGRRGDSLSFISTANLALSRDEIFSGRNLIEYSVEPGEESGLLQLYRTDTKLLPGVDEADFQPRKHIICTGLQEVRFIYLDEEGSEAEEWQEDEQQTVGEVNAGKEPVLPRLVYMELIFADSMESESNTVFRTAVALPQPFKDKG